MQGNSCFSILLQLLTWLVILFLIPLWPQKQYHAYGSDVYLVNVCSFTLSILFVIILLVFIKWYKRNDNQDRITKLKLDESNLMVGFRFTATTVGILEIVARLTSCIMWTTKFNVNNSSFFVAVWLPNLIISSTQILDFLFRYIFTCISKLNTHHQSFAKRYLSTPQIFLRLFAAVYILSCFLFPTIILTFVYPTQMIAVIAFVLAYLFATTVFSALLKKEYYFEFITKKTKLYFFIVYIIISLIILYLHCIGITFMYLLLIGRGSVINTGPLFLLSLFHLPSYQELRG